MLTEGTGCCVTGSHAWAPASACVVVRQCTLRGYGLLTMCAVLPGQ